MNNNNPHGGGGSMANFITTIINYKNQKIKPTNPGATWQPGRQYHVHFCPAETPAPTTGSQYRLSGGIC